MKRIIIIGLFWSTVNFVTAQEQFILSYSHQDTITQKDITGRWRLVALCNCYGIVHGGPPYPPAYPTYYTFKKTGDLSIKENDQIDIGTWRFAESNQLALSINDTIHAYRLKIENKETIHLRGKEMGMKFLKVTRQP